MPAEAIATPPNAAPPTSQAQDTPPAKAAPAKPKQGDQAEIRRSAVSGWMSGLEGLEPASAKSADAGTAPATGTPGAPPPEDKPKGAATTTGPTTATAPDKAAAPAPAEGDRWPRTAAEWDNFKKVRDGNYAKRDDRIKALEKELAERDTRLAALASAVDPKEHDAVKGERDKLSEALRLAAVEKHPRFVQYYDGKLGAQVELAKKLVGPELANEIETVLKMPDNEWRNSRLEEVLSNLAPMAANRLGGVLNAIDELRNERENEVARAREDYDRAVAKQASEAQAAQQAARAQAESTFERLLKEAQEEAGIPPLQLREGDENWNKAVASRVAAAKNILFGQVENPEHLIRAALSAVSFGPMLETLQSLQAENESLKAQVGQLKTSSPTVPHGARPAPNGSPAPRDPSARAGVSRPMAAAQEWMGLLNQAPPE